MQPRGSCLPLLASVSFGSVDNGLWLSVACSREVLDLLFLFLLGGLKKKKVVVLGARKMAQLLRALVALRENLGSVPTTHMAAHDDL